MLKKIIIGGLLVALIGVLVVGGINRTAARSGETSSYQRGQETHDVVAERGGRNGAGGNQGRVEAVGEANITEWQPVEGTVSSVDASHLEITLNDGDSVTLHGFDENGVFQVGQIDDQSNGQTLSLRDATGRPMWAGRGRS
jgi:hypothetical protein